MRISYLAVARTSATVWFDDTGPSGVLLESSDLLIMAEETVLDDTGTACGSLGVSISPDLNVAIAEEEYCLSGIEATGPLGSSDFSDLRTPPSRATCRFGSEFFDADCSSVRSIDTFFSLVLPNYCFCLSLEPLGNTIDWDALPGCQTEDEDSTSNAHHSTQCRTG